MSISSTVNRVSYTGNGAVDTYAYTFRITNQSHLLVTVRNTDEVETTLAITTDYTVTGVGSSGGGNVVLVDNNQAWLDADGDLITGYILVIRRVVPLTQTTDIRNQGDFYPETHEDALDKTAFIAQQQQDSIDKSVKLPETVDDANFNPTLPADLLDSADKVPLVNATGDGFADAADWPTADEIDNAQAYATAAAASAAAALVSEGASDVSAIASAASAASAAATLASAFFRDVVYVTSADSPLTISSAHNGKLISMNSSGGAITVNLPAIAGLTLPFNVGLLLATAGNTVTINRNGTDTISGATSKTLTIGGTGTQIVADTGAAPDDWTVLDFGTVADGSVTEAKLDNGAVSENKLADNSVSVNKIVNTSITSAKTNFTLPTVQRFTSGSGTYTTPAGTKYIRVKMVGGGGGVGTASNGDGATTTFGSSLLTSTGGIKGGTAGSSAGGAGGTNTINAPAITVLNIPGGKGGGGATSTISTDFMGAPGGGTPLGAGARGNQTGGGENAGIANTGEGAGTSGTNGAGGAVRGAGGGGGYIEAIITAPSATYAYAVGAGGLAGTSGQAGGSGVIIVEEYYN